MKNGNRHSGRAIIPSGSGGPVCRMLDEHKEVLKGVSEKYGISQAGVMRWALTECGVLPKGRVKKTPVDPYDALESDDDE